jgi:glycosyltransferase involved in cell wall biosynthesis
VISLTEEKSYHYRNRSEGIPVLASDVIGNRDIVEHGKNGFLYGNSEEFFHFACLLQPLKKLD